jgi:hypothetical protein
VVDDFLRRRIQRPVVVRFHSNSDPITLHNASVRFLCRYCPRGLCLGAKDGELYRLIQCCQELQSGNFRRISPENAGVTKTLRNYALEKADAIRGVEVRASLDEA